jgi:hypothetical protein
MIKGFESKLMCIFIVGLITISIKLFQDESHTHSSRYSCIFRGKGKMLVAHKYLFNQLTFSFLILKYNSR